MIKVLLLKVMLFLCKHDSMDENKSHYIKRHFLWRDILASVQLPLEHILNVFLNLLVSE